MCMSETKGQGNNKMKITKRQLRYLIREELTRLDEAMPPGGVPDVVGAVTGVRGEENRRNAVELTDDPDEASVSAAWPDNVYHNGNKVFDTFYKDNAAAAHDMLKNEGYEDAQEGYLGYDPESDDFVMGFDAFQESYDEYGYADNSDGMMEAVLILLDPSGRPLEIIASEPGGMYPEGHRALKASFPRIIDVRLD
jgi:hypothetical protein